MAMKGTSTLRGTVAFSSEIKWVRGTWCSFGADFGCRFDKSRERREIEFPEKSIVPDLHVN